MRTMWENQLSFLFLLFLSHNFLECHGQDRVVTTDAGTIRGALDSARGYYKFLGIPYGQVSATNPFGESSPYPPLEGVFEANDDTAVCAQHDDGEVFGVTDCLTLHVFVPATATATSRLPVMIWLHGGFFMRGKATESAYGPRYLVRHDIIFISLNYRSGPYGFMCLGLDIVPGNQGLKDQQLAFEWVVKNIEAFGGNPDDITIGGHSAGAHSVDFHLLSEKDAPYKKVIMQSGSSLARTVLFEPDRKAAIKIAEHLGLQPSNSRNAISLLAEADAHSVVNAARELNIEFKPCVEAEFTGVEPFISHSWIHRAVPKAKNVAILVGFNEYEMLINHVDEGPEHFENLNIFESYLNQTFDFETSTDEDKLQKMYENMRQFYMGDSTFSRDVAGPIIDFDSDYVYNYPTLRSVKKFLDGEARDIFLYMFAYSGNRNLIKILTNVNAPGANHADELGYLFEISDLPEQISSDDQLVLDRMTAMWANFVKYGDPTPQTTELLPVKWTPISKEIYHYIRIDSELSMERRPFNKRMAFFDLFYKFNEEYQRTFDDDFKDDTDSATNNPASVITLLSALIMLVVIRK